MIKPSLGPIPWLPPRGFCPNGGLNHPPDPCSNCVPAGGPHMYVLPIASLDQLRSFWTDYES